MNILSTPLSSFPFEKNQELIVWKNSCVINQFGICSGRRIQTIWWWGTMTPAAPLSLHWWRKKHFSLCRGKGEYLFSGGGRREFSVHRLDLANKNLLILLAKANLWVENSSSVTSIKDYTRAVLGCINRAITSRSQEVIVLLYNILARPHL